MYKITSYYAVEPKKIADYQAAMYRCWYEHVFYTRNAILAMLSNGEDTMEAINRLMKNQEDIGDLFRPFYDNDQINKMVLLLKEHITQAAAIVTATMAGEDTATLIDQWMVNCQMILQILFDLNPMWKITNLVSLWNTHLTLTLNEVKYRLEKNWSSDILNFDDIIENIYDIASIFLECIVDQYPLKFCSPVNQGTTYE